MSYDLEIWSQRKLDSNLLCLNEEWKISENTILYESKNWQVVCDINQAVEVDDVPDELLPLIPAISYLNSVYTEPSSAPKIAFTKAKQLARLISNSTMGVILDKQTNKTILPVGFKKYKKPKMLNHNRFDILNMVWYMKELPFKDKKDLAKFINELKRLIPEAIPKRYGDYEPPKYKLKEHGINHFIDYLYDDLFEEKHNSLIWYPTKPIVSINLDSGEISNRIGVRFPRFEIEFEASILNDCGWELQLKRIWKSLSKILKPFYGEVRVLKNAILSRTTYYSDSQTESPPTRSGFWMGIPQNLGLAIVLGKEYQDTWDASKKYRVIGNQLSFLEVDKWAEDNSLKDILGSVPIEISQKQVPKELELKTGGSTMNWNTEFPEYWPFKEITDKIKISHQFSNDDFIISSVNKKWWQLWK